MNFKKPDRMEIEHHTTKLIVGVIAISLPIITSMLSQRTITSISASYYHSGLARDLFVGSLFAIASFLLAYNGRSLREFAMAKIAAVAAVCVALFPCVCEQIPHRFYYVHGISAGILFSVLMLFCFEFWLHAKRKDSQESKIRAKLYIASGLTIFIFGSLVFFDWMSGEMITKRYPRFVYYGESGGLFAFGTSWLVASHCLPFISRDK